MQRGKTQRRCAGGKQRASRRRDDDDDKSWDGGGSSSDDEGSEWEEESEEDAPRRHRGQEEQPECVPPEDTSPEAAMRAAVSARRDLKKGAIEAAVEVEALHASRTSHEACMRKGSRTVRGNADGAQSRASVTAYYHAVAAATACLKRAYSPVKGPQGARHAAAANAHADEEGEDEEADIERERKRNIRRNHAELVKLGLA